MASKTAYLCIMPNKLIDRGLLEKADSGFCLTVKGARWINALAFTL